MWVYSWASPRWVARISPMASGDPHPIPPDSSFRLHMRRRIITLAASKSLSASWLTTTPTALTAPHLIFSLPLWIKDKRGLMVCRGGRRPISTRALSKSPWFKRSKSFFLRLRPPCFKSRVLVPEIGIGKRTLTVKLHVRNHKVAEGNQDSFSNWSFPAPHTGHTQSPGNFSKGVPAFTPLSGSPTAGSYTYPHTEHTYLAITYPPC